MCELTFYMKHHTKELKIKANLAIWIVELLNKCTVHQVNQPTFNQIKESFKQNNLGDFDVFWQSFTLQQLKQFGLLNI